MSAPLWFQNLVAYSLQIALMGAAGLILPRVLRLRTPRVLYRYWQALLAVCLLLPFVQPWRHFQVERSATAASRILWDSGVTVTGLATLSIARLLLVVLTGGVVLRLMWLALGLAKLRRCRESARRIAPLPRGMQEIATRLGVAPEFCLSGEIQGPATFGLRRPVILLPPRFMDLEAGRQQVIASHELLHVVRRDWAVNLAEEIVLAAFWFHPVVWWLVGRIRLSREQVVDQQVVELTGARKPYLYALVEIAAGPGAVRGLVAPAFLKECQLAERIRALVKEDLMSKQRIVITLACVAVLTLLAGLAIIRRFPLKAGGAPTVASNQIQAGPENLTVGNGVTEPVPMKAGGAPTVASNQVEGGPEIFSVGNGVTEPVPIYKPDPGYTQEARVAKLEGTVILSVIIGVDGDVTDVKVVKGLDKGLTERAVDTVRTWKFNPALKAGKPVPCRVTVEVSFRMF